MAIKGGKPTEYGDDDMEDAGGARPAAGVVQLLVPVLKQAKTAP